jgi:hypothetical protein
MFMGCRRPITEDDFSLTISVSSATFYQGEDIEVEMVFTNLRRRRLEIGHGTPMILPFIVNHDFPFYSEIRLGDMNISTIRAREIKTIKVNMGHRLPPGEYELMASASFTLDLEPPFQDIRVLSNTITLSVL